MICGCRPAYYAAGSLCTPTGDCILQTLPSLLVLQRPLATSHCTPVLHMQLRTGSLNCVHVSQHHNLNHHRTNLHPIHINIKRLNFQLSTHDEPKNPNHERVDNKFPAA